MKYRLDTLFCLKINDDNKTLTSPSKSFKLKVSCAVKLPLWGGTIAQCFRPGFESQADQLCFFDLLSNCVLHLSLRCEKKWKIPKKRLGLCAFIIFSQNLWYICLRVVKRNEKYPKRGWDCVLLSFLVKICATFVFALWKDTKYNQKEAGIGSNKWYWVFSGYLSLSF